jgi:hypothetical protein
MRVGLAAHPLHYEPAAAPKCRACRLGVAPRFFAPSTRGAGAGASSGSNSKRERPPAARRPCVHCMNSSRIAA